MRKMAERLGLLIVIGLMIACALTLLAPRFGWSVDVVCSGSMEPELKVGSVVITRPVRLEEIKPGDVIAFHSPVDGKLTSHRVVAVEGGPSVCLLTKGDANGDVDPFFLPAQSVVGKVCFQIPYFGYFAQFVKTPLGLLLAFCLPGLVIIVMEFRHLWRLLSEEAVEREYRVREK